MVTHFVTTFCLQVDKIHQCPSQSYSKACNMPTARKTSTNKIWGREKWSRHQSAELIFVTYETIWKFGEAASTKFLDGSYFCFIFLFDYCLSCSNWTFFYLQEWMDFTWCDFYFECYSIRQKIFNTAHLITMILSYAFIFFLHFEIYIVSLL